MKTNLTKSVLLSSSLLAALVALSSCGKSKDLKSSPPTPTAQTTQVPPTLDGGNTLPPATTPAPAAPAPVANPQLTAPTAPAAPSLDANQAIPQAPQGAPQAGTQIQNPQAPTPLQELPAAAKKPVVHADEINFKGQVAVKTGGTSAELLYTAAGDDDLMEEFKSYNAKVSAAQQTMNSNLAKAITGAKLSRVSSLGDMSIGLTVNEFGVAQTYRLIATTEGDKLKLSLSTKGTTGEMEFQGGFLKCLDVDGSCDTAYAKIKFAGGYTRVIFRNTFAETHFLLQENVSNNSGFSMWSDYILNAAQAVNTPMRIEGTQVSSYEVINGRAAAGVLISAVDGEVVGLSVPLVVSAKESIVNSAATKVSDISKNYDLTSTGSTSLSQKINAVKIVANNGRGQFKLQLQMGTEQNSASVWVVIARVQKEIMTIDQIRSLESKIKPF